MSATSTVVLAVDGMTCAACVGRVERKLERLVATVNLATGRATVTHPPSVAVAALVKTVERAGGAAGPMDDSRPPNPPPEVTTPRGR